MVVGKKEEEVVTNVASDTQTIAADTVQFINQLPWYYLVLLIFMAGWAIPSPVVMAKGFVEILRVLWPF